MSTIKNWRPLVALQSEAMDCAFACAATVLAMYGGRVKVEDLKAGASSRGTRLSELRDILRRYGADVSVVAFDSAAPGAIPSPCVALLKHGHYVVLGRKRRGNIDVYDPARGWVRQKAKTLARELQGFAIEVRGIRGDSNLLGSKSNTSQLIDVITDSVRVIRTRQGLRVALLAFVAQIIALAIPLATAGSVNSVLPGAGNSIGGIAGGFLAILLVGGACSAVSEFGIRTLTRRSTLAAGTWLFDRLAVKHECSGEQIVASRAFTQFSALVAIQRFSTELIIRLGTVVLLALAGMTALCFFSGWLIVASVVAITASITLDLVLRPAMLHAATGAVQSSVAVRAKFDGIVANIPALVRAGAEGAARATLRRAMREQGIAGARSEVLTATKGLAASFAKVLDTAIFTAIAGYFVIGGAYSLGAFVAVGLYKEQLTNSISSLFGLFREWEMLRPQRLHLDGLDSPAVTNRKKATVETGRLKLDKVSFSYARTEPLVLRNLAFCIEAGELAVLIGESGSGKSTLLRLVLGDERSSDGTIEVDGLDPRKLKLHGVGAIMQSDRLMAGSIRENVAFYRNRVSDAEVYAALDMACAADFVRELPLRLDTRVGDGVAGLSGGQRQRILLARALVRSPRLLVLDEATSSVDAATEKRILEKIRATGATILACTHRSEVRSAANVVLELQNGAVKVRRYNDLSGPIPTRTRPAQV